MSQVNILATAVNKFFEEKGSKDCSDKTLISICDILGVERPPITNDPAFSTLVALSLSPVEAIHYELTDPRPKWKYIRDYLAGFSELSNVELELTSRRIARVLDSYSQVRSNVSLGSDGLLEKQGNACAICRLPFNSTPQSIKRRDVLRPIWLAAEELARPEIDHIQAIAWQGDNAIENLQILCRACNAAKSDGLRLSIRHEAEMASKPIDDVPRIHLFRLFVWLVQDRTGSCDVCGSCNGELTMQLLRSGASLVRANLELICYRCVDDVSTDS